MGKFLAVLIVAGLGGLYYYQTHPRAATAPEEKPAPATQAAASKPQAPAQPSEHNWMKRSLDRASEVAHQSRARTQQSQDP
jgi:hypothetical protein